MIYTENYMNQKTVFGTESSMVGWGWNLPRDAETQREREYSGSWRNGDSSKTKKKFVIVCGCFMGGLLFKTPFYHLENHL